MIQTLEFTCKSLCYGAQNSGKFMRLFSGYVCVRAREGLDKHVIETAKIEQRRWRTECE